MIDSTTTRELVKILRAVKDRPENESGNLHITRYERAAMSDTADALEATLPPAPKQVTARDVIEYFLATRTTHIAFDGCTAAAELERRLSSAGFLRDEAHACPVLPIDDETMRAMYRAYTECFGKDGTTLESMRAAVIALSRLRMPK